jgi:hypothetical protein
VQPLPGLLTCSDPRVREIEIVQANLHLPASSGQLRHHICRLVQSGLQIVTESMEAELSLHAFRKGADLDLFPTSAQRSP